MYLKRGVLFLFVFLLFIQVSFAQEENQCALEPTPEILWNIYSKIPAYAGDNEEIIQAALQGRDVWITNNPGRATKTRIEIEAGLRTIAGIRINGETNGIAAEEIIEFDEKFLRQREGISGPVFSSGELIQADFIVEIIETKEYSIDRSKVSLLVDMGDIRHSDKFVIAVNEEKFNVLMNLQGIPFKGIVKVTGEGKYIASNMFSYPADLMYISTGSIPVNPSDIDTLGRGDNVLIEGKVVDYSGNKIIIEVEEERIIEIEIDSGSTELEFEACPIMDNLRGKMPEAGDIVRVRTYVTSNAQEDTIMDYGENQISRNKLSTSWCRSLYLLKPSEVRQERYDELRDEVSSNILLLKESIQRKDYEDARRLSSETIKKELIPWEREDLENSISLIPEAERPLLLWYRYTADEVNKIFGRDIDSMTLSQFKEFSRSVARMEIPQKEEGDPTYIYRIITDLEDFPKQEFEDILLSAINTRYRYLRNLDEDRLSNEFKNIYMLEQSLNYLGYHDISTVGLRNLLDFVSMEIERVKNRDTRWEFLYNAIDSVENIYYGANEKGRTDLLQLFDENTQLLRSWEERLVDMQVAQPHTSQIVIVSPDGLLSQEGLSFVPREIMVSHRFSIVLDKLRNVLQDLNPSYDELREGNFHEEMMKIIRQLSSQFEFFSMVERAVEVKGYRFTLFDMEDPNINPYIKTLFVGSYGAVTSKVSKEVYFDLDILDYVSYSQNTDQELFLRGVMANEGVHILSDNTYKALNDWESADEIRKMRGSDEFTAAEIEFYDMIQEEILSQIVDDLVFLKLKDPKKEIDIGDIRSPDSEIGRRVMQIKLQLGGEFTSRIFDLESLSQNDIDFLFENVADFLNSGDVENFIIEKVREYKLAQ